MLGRSKKYENRSVKMVSDDYEFFKNKKSDKVYLSKQLENKSFKLDENGEVQELIRPFRYISKIINTSEDHKFIKDGKQVSLRITGGDKQEIVAKFYEDTRSIFTLQIQKYTIESGSPHNTYFTFQGEEIRTLYNFIRNICLIPIKSKEKEQLSDEFVSDLILTRAQFLELASKQPDLIEELMKNQITAQDVVNLGYRKEQLDIFDKLLNDSNFFESMKTNLGSNKRDEDVWQAFFEKNTWIFGYGLSYIFNSTLDNSKLEQVVKGSSFTGAGKRVDALLKSKGIINSLCFAEIKTHKCTLLKKVNEPYRKECWAPSAEFSGAIAQIQKTVQLSLEEIKTKTQVKDDTGSLTGENLYLYQPKSFLVIGMLSEFAGEHGENEEKFSSFELLRRNLINPDVITFDELYQRAKYIVDFEEN
jgi:Domain of unknown function (DUF4263)